MQSHDLARRLLERDDAPVVFQLGLNDKHEGDLLPDVIDISRNSEDDPTIVVELSDIDHPAHDGPTPLDWDSPVNA